MHFGYIFRDTFLVGRFLHKLHNAGYHLRDRCPVPWMQTPVPPSRRLILNRKVELLVQPEMHQIQGPMPEWNAKIRSGVDWCPVFVQRPKTPVNMDLPSCIRAKRIKSDLYFS